MISLERKWAQEKVFCQPTHLSKGGSVIPADPATLQKVGGSAAIPRASFFAVREYLLAESSTMFDLLELVSWQLERWVDPKECSPNRTSANFQHLLSKELFGKFAGKTLGAFTAAQNIFCHSIQPRFFCLSWKHSVLSGDFGQGARSFCFSGRSWIDSSQPSVFVQTGSRSTKYVLDECDAM